MSGPFRPPALNNVRYSGAQSPSNGNPPSPPRMGYVAGAADTGGGMNGYVGQKPTQREVPEQPTARRQQMPSLASPDPSMANAAFTQSQFTQGLDGRPPTRDEQRIEGLRKFKEGGYGGGGRNRGSAASCGITPHPSFSNMTREQRRKLASSSSGGNRRSPANLSDRVSLTNNDAFGDMGDPDYDTNYNGDSAASEISQISQKNQRTPSPKTNNSTSSSNSIPAALPPTYCPYTLSDPGLAYKVFNSTRSWTSVLQMIVPNGKRVTRVYVTSMLQSADSSLSASERPMYSLRLVAGMGANAPVLWADYACDNTDDFKLFTITPISSTDATTTNSTSNNLLYVQVQQATGLPVLVSSVLMECLDI